MFGGPIIAFAFVALWAYCIFDVIRTDDSSVQNLPKMFWLLIVIFVPTIGSAAWLLLGRPSSANLQIRRERRPRPEAPNKPPSGSSERPRPSPEDHAAKREEALKRYMAEREEMLQQREAEVRRLEDELRRRERGDEGPPG